MTQQKRSIRLKELGVRLNKIYEPAEDYLSSRPSLNKHEIYHVTTDIEGNQTGILGGENLREVFLLGGSTIESVYLRASKRPHSLLEIMLRSNGYPYVVKNLGVSGSTTIHLINLIINKLYNKPGALVAVSIPTNDLSSLCMENGYFNHHKFFSPLLPATAKSVKRHDLEFINFEDFRKNLLLIKNICESLKLNLVFTTSLYCDKNDGLAMLNRELISFCSENNVSCLNLERDVNDAADYYDQVHFLENGSHKFAKFLFQFLRENELLGPSQECKPFHKQIINSEMELVERLRWSEWFLLNSDISHTVKIVCNMEFGDYENPMALFSVDFEERGEGGRNMLDGSLKRSTNPEIGFFNYISGVCGKRIERIYTLNLPKECSKFRIGVRSWKGKASISDFQIYVM